MPTGGWWDTVPTSATRPYPYWSVIPPYPYPYYTPWWQQGHCPCPNCIRPPAPNTPYYTFTCSNTTSHAEEAEAEA